MCCFENQKEREKIIALKSGDLVHFVSRFKESIEKVERVTKTMVILNGRGTVKFRKCDGREVGNMYSDNRIHILTPENEARIKQEIRVSRIIKALDKLTEKDLLKLPEEDLARIEDLLSKMELKK